MEKIEDVFEAVDKIPQIAGLAVKLKLMSGIVWFLVSLASFGIFFLSWYSILFGGFTWDKVVSMGLAVVFGIAFNGMIKQ